MSVYIEQPILVCDPGFERSRHQSLIWANFLVRGDSELTTSLNRRNRHHPAQGRTPAATDNVFGEVNPRSTKLMIRGDITQSARFIPDNNASNAPSAAFQQSQ